MVKNGVRYGVVGGRTGTAGGGGGSTDNRGRHRILAELNRLEQELKFLQSSYKTDDFTAQVLEGVSRPLANSNLINDEGEFKDLFQPWEEKYHKIKS
ncbi:hypothetical protein Prudu_022989 [Prunus dulcis]|uniref:Uncharacterized protein n=1 Tax=Prunus dulcis TaxID=3755 RepID=A0A4Y1S285_PRUDU|nr:hypothetical protein Prudu_022989 [Prunus dulcis]